LCLRLETDGREDVLTPTRKASREGTENETDGREDLKTPTPEASREGVEDEIAASSIGCKVESSRDASYDVKPEIPLPTFNEQMLTPPRLSRNKSVFNTPDLSSPVLEEQKRSYEKNTQIAIAHQERQADKMKKLRRDNLTANIGDAVALNLQPNERQSNNSSQVIAIVFNVSDSGSIACVTNLGIIGSVKDKKPRYFRDDRQIWNLSTGVLVKGLRDIQLSIQRGDFDQSDYKFVSLSQTQMKETLGIDRCHCKQGCKTKRCPCRKYGRSCKVSCLCVACTNQG